MDLFKLTSTRIEELKVFLNNTKELSYIHLDILDHLNIEIFFVKIRFCNKHICIITHYNLSWKIIESKIFEILETLKFECLIFGDLNSQTKLLGCHKTDRNGLELEKIILRFNFIVLNNEKFTYN